MWRRGCVKKVVYHASECSESELGRGGSSVVCLAWVDYIVVRGLYLDFVEPFSAEYSVLPRSLKMHSLQTRETIMRSKSLTENPIKD